MNHTKRHLTMTLVAMVCLIHQPLTAEAPPVETPTDTQSSPANNISTQSCGVYVTVDPHICRNVDDDQTPDSEDYEKWDIDHDPSDAEDDLKPITITGHAGPTGGTMTLEIISGGDKIDNTFWEDDKKDQQAYQLSWYVPANTSRSETLYIEGFANSDVPKDVKFRAIINCPAGTVGGTNYSACSSTDYAETAVYEVDLDIDTKNDNGSDVAGYDNEEDKIEISEKVEQDGSKKPGKIIIASPYENFDSDFIYDHWDLSISGKKFIPIQIKLSPAYIPSKAVVNFSYLDSPPIPDSIFNIILGIFSPLEKGGLRLWKNDAPSRTLSDYIPVNEEIPWASLPKNADDPHTVVLYLEYVDKPQPEAAGRQTIKVTAKYDEYDDKECHDEVHANLVPVDLDIEHGYRNEFEELKENIGDGGYISLKSQTPQGEDITPTTYLVIRPANGLPNNSKIRLKFNSGGHYKVARDRLGTDPVISEVIEFPAGQETHLYLLGETKSQSRGGENITMQIKVDSSWADGDSLKATVVQTQYQIDLRVFIPYNWVNIPHPFYINQVAIGDSRSYDPHLIGTFRVAQRVILNLYHEWEPGIENRIIDSWNVGGLSQNYYDSDVTNWDDDAIHSEKTIMSPSYINSGATPVTSGTADISQVLSNVQNYGPTGESDDTKTFVSFDGAAADPLIVGAADIDWRITVGISKSDPLNPQFVVQGVHDGFPAYEIYINSNHPIFPYTNVLQWEPNLEADVTELIGFPDVTMPTKIGLIKQ
jgi:hypothetical protein